MLLHEFLEDVGLRLFVRCGESHCLLSLVVHHLLHGLSRFAVKVVKLRVFRDNLLQVKVLSSYGVIIDFFVVSPITLSEDGFLYTKSPEG